ncbi:DUF4114 domain-containing protein [Aquabacter sp. CN5-332]|uniref:DUF4114 domain-containing protein n=1 Tax=Aquabacter sp. CN5-332 TaxID=3156608 RepID=UPI0032B342A2
MSDNDYNAIAGFDTSSIGLDATSVQDGLTGVAVANAVIANLTGPARYANGVALIEAAASDGNVSPVQALLAFAHTLTALDGDSSHIGAIGAEIARLIATDAVDVTDAMDDVSDATSEGQISGIETLHALLAVAADGPVDVQIRAGMVLAWFITNDHGGSEGGSEGGGEGGGEEGGGETLTLAATMQAIEDAISNGILSETEAYGLLAGIIARPNSQYSGEATSELAALIGGDSAATHQAIQILAIAAGIGISEGPPGDEINNVYYSGQSISALAASATPALSVQDIADDINAAVQDQSLPALSAIYLLGRFAGTSAATVVAEVLDFVENGFVSGQAALNALTAVGLSNGAQGAARLLISVVVAEADLAYTAGLSLATLVDTTTPLFALPNWKLSARDMVLAITNGISNQGLPAAGAVELLVAIATVPGGLVQDRSAMNAATDGVRTLVEGGAISVTDATAAIVSIIGTDGPTVAQGMAFLIALGGSGRAGPLGAITGNPELIAGAGEALADLIHDRAVPAADIATAIDIVFAGGITNYLGVDDPSLALSVLIKAAAVLAVLESGGLETIGAALALPAQDIGSYAMSAVSNGLQGGVLTDLQAIHVVVGFAGSGSDGDLIAAGRELTFILNRHMLTPAQGLAEIAAAVTAETLTPDQAILLLAGAATGTPPVGLTAIYAQIAAYLDADPATGVGVLEGALEDALLNAGQALTLLAQAAALGSAQTASAATDALLSWVDGAAITADAAATQLLGLANGGARALQAIAGANIAALIAHGAISLGDAIALVDAAVPSALDADVALTVLVHMAAAGDAALQTAVQDEIDALISNGDITLQAVIADLQALRAGASAAVQAIIDVELGILITDPETLAETAGLGSIAQVAAAALAIANLFGTDPTAAQTIIDALAGRIESSNLTASQAANLLAQIYAHGGDGVLPILEAMVDLTTPQGNPATAPIWVGTMSDAIAAQLTAGALDAAEAFVAFGQLSAVNGATVNGTVATLLSGGIIAVSALDAAVDAGTFTPSNAITVLGNILPGASAGLRTEAVAEIAALVGTDPALAAQALTRFMSLAGSGDHDLRLVGNEGIEALAAAVPGVGDAAFLQLLGYYPLPDSQADIRAALTALLADGSLTPAEALDHIAGQLLLSNPSPLINATQALSLLVALSSVADARDAIYAYMGQVAAANWTAQNNGTPVWGFLPQAAITALASGAGADMDRIAGTAAEIASLGAGYLSSAQIRDSLFSANLTTAQRVTLMAEVAGFANGADAPSVFGTSIAGLIASLSAADQRASLDAISTLIGDLPDHLTAAKAVSLLFAVYSAGSASAKDGVLAELTDIGAGSTQPGGVTQAIVAVMVAGTVSMADGMGALTNLAVGGAAGFSDAVAISLELALVGGELTAPAVMTALEASISGGNLTAQQAVGLLESVLIARFEAGGDPMVTATLQTAILGEIDALITSGQVTLAEAISAMTAAASGASDGVLLAIGGEIADFLGGHAGSEAQSVAGIVAASADHVITGAEALALLVGIAIPADAALQAATGGGIAALVASGAVTENAATGGVYSAYLEGGLPLDHLVAVVAGAWAEGGATVGAKILDQVESHGFATYADLAGQFADAVDAGTLTAAEMVAGAAAVVVVSGDAEGGASFLSALISEGLMDADDALVALGASISASGFTAAAAISVIVELADGLPASLASLGVGIAELVAAGKLAFADVGTALSDAVDGGVLSFTEAVTLLISAAGDTSAAAEAAGIAGQVGAQLVTLIGSDAQHFTDVLDVIHDAATGGTLPIDIAIPLLGGLAGAGTQSQQLAVGAELKDLIDADLTDFDTIRSTLTTEAEAGHISAVGAVLIILQLAPDTSTISLTLIGQSIDFIISGGALSASDAAGAIVAAAHDSTQPISLDMAIGVLVELAERHVSSPIDAADAAVIAQAGAALADLVDNGDLTASDLLGRLASLPAFGAIPLLAAIEAGAGLGTELGQSAHNALLDHLNTVQIHDFVESVGQLIGTNGLSAADGLSILMGMATDGLPAQVAVGHEFTQLISAGRATMSDVHTALVDADFDPGVSAIILAGMIDTSPGAYFGDVLAELNALEMRELPNGASSYRPFVQQLIAAISDAVNSPVQLQDATGLYLGQAVLALSAFARVGDSGVMEDVGAAIAALIGDYPQSQDGVIALLSMLVATGDGAYTNIAAKQLAYLGDALGLTAEQFVQAVAGTVDDGLSAEQVLYVLAHLTAINPVNLGGPSDADFYPNIGIAAGVAIAGLVGGNFTFGQALDVLDSVFGVSADNTALLLLGFASAGTAADQIAVGRALASIASGNIFQELGLVPDDVANMVRLGMMVAGGTAGGTIGVGLDDAAVAEILTGLDTAVDAGTMSAIDALQALVSLVSGTTRQGDSMAVLRMAVFDALANLVPEHITADNAMRVLLTPPSGVTDNAAVSMEAEAGSLIASLVKAGLLTPGAVSTAIDTALSNHTLAPEQAVAIITGATLYHDYTDISPVTYDLPVALGQYLGGLIDNGDISVSAAMDAVQAAQSSYRMGYVLNEVALLAAVASHGASGLQAAVGETLVGVFGAYGGNAEFMSLFDTFVNQPGMMTAGQAMAVLLGMADNFETYTPLGTTVFRLSGVQAVAVELVTLIGRGALTEQGVVDDVAGEISAGRLSVSYGLSLMTYLVSSDGALTDIVTDEISALITGGSLTLGSAVDGLFFAAGNHPATDLASVFVVSGINRIMGDLVEDGHITLDAAVTHIVDAVDADALSLPDAVGVLAGLASAATDEAAFERLGAALGSLFAAGMAPGNAEANLSHALDAGWATTAKMASLIAYAAGVTSSLPNANDYDQSLAIPLARAGAAGAVDAVDRAYEADGIPAAHVVQLLTYVQFTSALGSQTVIGPELMKMAVDGGLGIPAVIDQIISILPNFSYYAPQLISAMAVDADVASQVALGHAMGDAVVDGDVDVNRMLAGVSMSGLDSGRANTQLLAIAGGGDAGVQLAIGKAFGTPLASIPVSADAVDTATTQMLEGGLTDGALTAAQLAVVLAGMGQVDFPSPYSAHTASYELNALVTAGSISASDAMAAIDGAVGSLDLGKLVHWLAGASTYSALHDAVAEEIADLADAGSATGILDYIKEITGTTPIDVAALTAISSATAAHLYISVAGFGDAGTQDAVGTKLALVVSGNSTYLNDIDAAVTDGSLSGAGAVHVIANLLAALSSDPSSAIGSWAASHIDAYVADGRVDTATAAPLLLDAAAHATTAGLAGIGAVMGSLEVDPSAVQNALAAGDLTDDQAVRLLLGFGIGQSEASASFLAARDALVALVEAGEVSGAEIMQDAASTPLSVQQRNAIAFGLIGHGSAADDAAIGTYFAAGAAHFGAQFGAGDDPFFTGSLSEVGLVFAKIQVGQMSVTDAITDLEQYAAAHNVSTFAALYSLNSLLTGEGNGVSAVRAEMIDKIAIGDLSAELAWRVAEGTTAANVRDAQGNVHQEAPDPTALTQQEARQLLAWEGTLAFMPDQVSLVGNMFGNDLWVAQQLRANTVGFLSMDTVVNAMRLGTYYLNTGIQGVGQSTYAYDLALVSMLHGVTESEVRSPFLSDYSITLNALSTRLLNGGAEDTLVKQYVAGNLTSDQVLEALDKEVQATGLGSQGADTGMMHDIGLAWLHLRARQLMANNPGTDDAFDARQLIAVLDDAQYKDDILTGYGALLGMSSSGAGATITSIERQLASQGATSVIRQHLPPGTTLSDRDQAFIDTVTTMGNGMAWVLNKHPLGRAYVSVLDDPQSANAYTQLGIQIATMVGTKAAVDAMFAGTPMGLAITATKLGAQAGLYVLGMGAVQGAISEVPGAYEYLHGQLTIAAATASLIGDVVGDLSTEAAHIIVDAVPNLISFGNAVASGDAEGMATSIGNVAMDYYMLQTGVDPRLYVPVAEHFADFIVHLFTGDVGALDDDIKAMGSAYLDTIIKNPYLAAIGDRMVQYASTINDALAEINDSYRILGQNIYTGLLYVGTGFDEAGNLLRSVAHTIGDFVDDVLEGLGIDGYISGATVFADANFNGVLDAGEAHTTTDTNGRYALVSGGAPLILTGGIDTATNLPFDGTMLAPAGSTAITPLTTLVQKVAAAGSGDPAAAQQVVAAALGLHSGLDLNDLDPIAATRIGVAGAAEAFATASSILNTVALLEAAGATDDPFDAIAARLAAAAAGAAIDLTDPATVAAIAASAGVPAGIADAVVQLVVASNTLMERNAAAATDPISLLEAVTAVSIAAQGDTSHALAAAGSDPALLASVLAGHTGANLANQVAADRAHVGDFGDSSAGGGEVPLKISLDGHGIELSLDNGAAIAGNWVRFSALDSGLQPGSTLLIYAVDGSGNLISREDHHAGSDVTLEQAVLASIGAVADDHGASLLLGAQSVYLPAGEQLRFALLGGDHAVDPTPDADLVAWHDGSLQVTIEGQHLSAVANNALSDATELANAQRTTGKPFVFLQQGETLNIELTGSSANTNTLGFVHVDVDAGTGAWSVGGVAYGDTDAFAEAVRSHMDSGIREDRGGDFDTHTNWTVAGATGYYAPVLLTPSGETFVIGNANPGGYEYIRMYGENTFGFEDLAYNQGSDFDYNDMVIRLVPAPEHLV